MDYKTARSHFSKMFKRLREATRVTYQELENRTGVANPNLVAIAEGRRPIKMDTAGLLADIFCLHGEERGQFLNLALATHQQQRLKSSSKAFDPLVLNLASDVLLAAGVTGMMVRSCQPIDPHSQQFASLRGEVAARLKAGKAKAGMIELHLNDGSVVVGCFTAARMN